MVIDEKSIVKPAPIVVDNVIFFIYMPLDEAGLAFFKSPSNADILSIRSSVAKSILPTVQWIIPFLSVLYLT